MVSNRRPLEGPRAVRYSAKVQSQRLRHVLPRLRRLLQLHSADFQRHLQEREFNELAVRPQKLESQGCYGSPSIPWRPEPVQREIPERGLPASPVGSRLAAGGQTDTRIGGKGQGLGADVLQPGEDSLSARGPSLPPACLAGDQRD